MPNSTQEEKYRWIKPILDHEITCTDMAKICPFSERALKYWLAAYRRRGMAGLQNTSTRPKHHPRETPIRVKERIIEMRKKESQCAMKLAWDLADEGVAIHERTVGKILKGARLTRRYRTRKVHYRYVRSALVQGEMIEIDVKYVPGRLQGKRHYQFTGIDCASRWRYLQIYDDMSTYNARRFLGELVAVAPFTIQNVKTDNGSCFTNRYTGYYKSTLPFPRTHAFDHTCTKYGMTHYLIDPGKPQQQGTVERSHRTDQEMFYDTTSYATIEELRYKLRLWNMHYNDTKHCGLNGLTPNQALRLRVQNVCA